MTADLAADGPPAIAVGYEPPPGVFDEMRSPDGGLRPHWRYLLEALDGMGPSETGGRLEEARRLIRDNGVTYNVYGDPQGISRPWELDLMPLLIPSDEWSGLERGLMQRAELLNRIALDLYGDRTLIHRGLLPPELVYGHPGFLLPCHRLRPSRDRPLVLYAADLTRTPQGGWCVLADRTQAPSGAGYALENRMVVSRVMPSLFRDSHVHRLAGFFRALRRALMSLAPQESDPGRIAVLTPGPSNEAYFEHAYLANYLGYTLVQGGDLTVRNGALWLKTLDRLERIDVVLRRVDDLFCDPLELREDSLLGAPGLLQAARSGNVALANALGTGILEHPALSAFLPAIAGELFGEDLLLESIPTHWCGDPPALEFVLGNLGGLVIRSMRSDENRPILGDQLSPAERDALVARLRAQPHLYVAQEARPLATVPTLAGDGTLQGRPATLRSFLVAGEEGYEVMPGGLTRVGPQKGCSVISNQLGGVGKDTWVIASEPERRETLLLQTESRSFVPKTESEISSRVADNLFWIGRYGERAEGLVRLLRILIIKVTEGLGSPADRSGLTPMRPLLRALTEQSLTYPGFVGDGAEARLNDPVPEMLSLITEAPRIGGLPQTLRALGNAAWSVRDRLSTDTWRIVDEIERRSAALTASPARELAQTLDELDPLITALVAFSALSSENLIRNEGWRFLQAGRRLERCVHTTALLRATLVPIGPPAEEGLVAEAVLSITDSLATSRRRNQNGGSVAGLLDLVLQDESNPRSVAFQLAEIDDLVGAMPHPAGADRLSRPEKLALQALSAVRLAELGELAAADNGERGSLKALLTRVGSLAAALSDALTAEYFRHEERPFSLLSNGGGATP